MKRPTSDQLPPVGGRERGWYERREVQRVLDAGPAADETWYRVQVTGKEATRHLSISEATLRRIADVLAEGASS